LVPRLACGEGPATALVPRALGGEAVGRGRSGELRLGEER
jgi:hypothetical protein